jgi:hypothetical protein
MRKVFFAGLILFGFSIKASADAPQINISTHVSVWVGTTPKIILSTGTNVPCIAGFNTTLASFETVMGQYLCGRTHFEIQNNLTASVWIGNRPQVSTIPASVDYGIQIPTGTTRVNTDNWPLWYIVSGGVDQSTGVVVIQKK